MKKQEKFVGWVVCIILLLLGLPTLFYYNVFHSNGISKLSSDWSNFGTYLSVFVSLCNLYIFIVLTIRLYRYNENRDKNNDTFQRSIQQPVLILKSSIVHEKELWSIENIGNGPALNIKIMDARERPQWQLPMTKCYSLGKDKSLSLEWLVYANIICAIYEDIFGSKYVTIGADDESHFRTVDEKFFPIEVDRCTFNKSTSSIFGRFNRKDGIKRFKIFLLQLLHKQQRNNQFTCIWRYLDYYLVKLMKTGLLFRMGYRAHPSKSLFQ